MDGSQGHDGFQKEFEKHDMFCSSCSLRLDIIFVVFFCSLARRMMMSKASSGSLLIDCMGYVVDC
jgi:hypothetical protein